MNQVRTLLGWMLSLGILVTSIYGVYRAMHSSLFSVSVLEITEEEFISSSPNWPVNSQIVENLSGIQIGKQSLVDLDLPELRKKLTSHPWIRDVEMKKVFPQTLAIHVKYRQPRALFQHSNGTLEYLDREGVRFASLDLGVEPDLSIISGLSVADATRLREALRLLDFWDRLGVNRLTKVSGIHWKENTGFLALIVYSLGSRGPVHRTVVEFGKVVSSSLILEFEKLNRVLAYLRQNNITAHRILIGSDKKIVVKTALGS